MTPKPDMNVSVESDLRGMRRVRSRSSWSSTCTDAFPPGLPWVRIIHGKGRGRCGRSCVTCCRITLSWSAAETARQNEGGDGATVAYLRGKS